MRKLSLKNFKLSLRTNNIQQRFVLRVLVPPFVILLVLGILIFWQLDNFVRQQAIDELKRDSSTTAVRLEREFTIRKTILSRTGEELFFIKSSYLSSIDALGKQRTECSAHVKSKRTFVNAPNNSCEPFLAEFAVKGSSSLQAVEDGYIRVGEELIQTQNQAINDRLSAYKQFFPETVALLVINDSKEIVSSAQSELLVSSIDALTEIAGNAISEPVEGKLVSLNDINLSTFAYPITGGSVLAAYDTSSESFIRESWQSTPIDKNESIALILDSNGSPVYPVLPFSNNIKDVQDELRNQKSVNINLKDIDNLAVASEVGSSKWLVVVSSPSVAVLAPLKNAQVIAVLIIGTLLVGFLWVGAFFIKRTVDSILGLVSGALVFSGGKLDYKIQLKNSDEEFVALANTMNNMADRIAKIEKEVDEKNKEFISIATHELRTPLTAIIGNLSMITEDFGSRLDETIKPLVGQVFESSVRLKELVNDMLDVARLEGGRVEFSPVNIDIKLTSKAVIDNLQITAKENGISLTYSEAGALEVFADEARLRIILNNFVSNAIKYNRPNGSVTVSHSMKDGKLVTSIADTGLGIPEEQKAHMFEKFFRVKNDDRKNVVGTGLGMYITREYILSMNGELWFESIHGQGTTFYFTLPLPSN